MHLYILPECIPCNLSTSVMYLYCLPKDISVLFLPESLLFNLTSEMYLYCLPKGVPVLFT